MKTVTFQFFTWLLLLLVFKKSVPLQPSCPFLLLKYVACGDILTIVPPQHEAGMGDGGGEFLILLHLRLQCVAKARAHIMKRQRLALHLSRLSIIRLLKASDILSTQIIKILIPIIFWFGRVLYILRYIFFILLTNYSLLLVKISFNWLVLEYYESVYAYLTIMKHRSTNWRVKT